MRTTGTPPLRTPLAPSARDPDGGNTDPTRQPSPMAGRTPELLHCGPQHHDSEVVVRPVLAVVEDGPLDPAGDSFGRAAGARGQQRLQPRVAVLDPTGVAGFEDSIGHQHEGVAGM